MAIDPICGMQVDPGTARFSLEHDGEPVYFCSAGCQSQYARRHGLSVPDRAPQPANAGVFQIQMGPPVSDGEDSVGGCCAAPASEPPSCCGGASSAGSKANRVVQSAYFCPCCPTVESDSPGDCPHCGMPLQANPAARRDVEYVCPMHPEVRRAEPGACPICGMDLEPTRPTATADDMGRADISRRLVVAATLTTPLFLIAMGPMIGLRLPGVSHQVAGWLQFALALPVVTWSAWPLWTRAVNSVIHRSPNMFTLIALGTWAALGLSLVALIAPGLLPTWANQDHGGWYFESAAVIITLVLLGQWLEIGARLKVQSALGQLLALNPTHATLLTEGQEQSVPIEQLKVGDRVRVKPGERVPIDGHVLEGASHLDEAMVTGESLPVARESGDDVVGGTINGEGALLIEVRATTRDSLLARIIHAVTEAQRTRAPIQKLADQVASVFVPIVIVCALAAALAWWIWGPADERLSSAALAAISVLLIACPCALGLATPVSIMVGVGRAARGGILIKQGAALQRLAQVRTIVFDKTGTLTEGKARVDRIELAEDSAEGFDEARVLASAAAVERGSEHPLAAAIVLEAQRRELSLPTAAEISIQAGSGVRGRIDGHVWRLGRAPWLEEVGGRIPEGLRKRVDSVTGTVVWVARDTNVIGAIVLADAIKPNAVEAVRSLRELGCTVHLASGDRAAVARSVAAQVGIEQVLPDALPEDKQRLIRSLQQTGQVVAMVGDGINDAPSLAAADVGIAMGTGTDVAIETADVSLVAGDPRALAEAIRLSRRVMTNIRQNLFFAFAYNAIGIPIAAGVLYPWLGWTLSPMVAAAAMSFSSVSVIGNALRLRT